MHLMERKRERERDRELEKETERGRERIIFPFTQLIIITISFPNLSTIYQDQKSALSSIQNWMLLRRYF